jgi:hypothetical protein
LSSFEGVAGIGSRLLQNASMKAFLSSLSSARKVFLGLNED